MHLRKVARLDVAVVEAGDLSGPELKAVLGECQAIVSSRYHTLVAGLSMGIPCLAMGWHHKYRELLSLFGLEQYAFDYSELDQGALIAEFDGVWEDRQLLTMRIHDELPEVETAVMNAACDVVHYLASRSPGHEQLAKTTTALIRPCIRARENNLDSSLVW